jgi:hypothetical protein
MVAASEGKERQELLALFVPDKKRQERRQSAGRMTVDGEMAAAEADSTAAAATVDDLGEPAWPRNCASMSRRSRKHYIARNRPHRD